MRAPRRGEAAHRIEWAAPLAVRVADRALAQARVLDAPGPMLEQDYRVGCRFLAGTDPVEGMRVVLFDKGDVPGWSPSTLAQVDDELVATFFAPLGKDELDIRRDIRRDLG